MIERIARWVALLIAITAATLFLVAQRQSADVEYGRSPSASGGGVSQGNSGENGATVPSVAEMTALVNAEPVVRLPGAVATWDTELVGEAIGDSGLRILVAPPGLSDDDQKSVADVDAADLRITGLSVSGGSVSAAPNLLIDWQRRFAHQDVTSSLLAVIAHVREQPRLTETDIPWRDPTAAELSPVVAALRDRGLYIAPGATLTKLPETQAFPERPLVAAFPAQTDPAYGPQLAKAFPDTPIVVMYGSWIEYHGPQQADFAEVAAAGYYAQFGDRLSRFAYPQDNALYAYLNRVTDIRYSGLFDRPLPYQPYDPLRVALPALPWLFALCVAVFLVLTVRSVRRPKPLDPPSRLAGLTALAVEMSALSDRSSDAALTRAITQLTAARENLDEDLLARAEADLDEAARRLPYPGFRPADYLGRQP